MPRALLFCLTGCLLCLAAPGYAAESEKRPRSVLDGVPGLERRVTYSEPKIPLGDLVAKVAADTGVPLTAARDVADEPVAVVVKELPAPRQALRQGKALPLTQLSPRLRPLVPATLNRVARHRYPLMDLNAWASGSLTFAGEPQVRIREESGGVVSIRTESAQEAAAGAPTPQPRADASRSGSPSVSIRRYPVTRLKMQIHYGPEQPVSVNLIIAAGAAD